MQVVTELVGVKESFSIRYPPGEVINCDLIEFRVIGKFHMEAKVGLGFFSYYIFGRDRRRVVVLVNKHPEAELSATDDYSTTGELLGIIKKPKSQEMYSSNEALPNDYSGFEITVYRDRTRQKGAFNKLAIIANIADFPTMIKHGLIQAKWADRLSYF